MKILVSVAAGRIGDELICLVMNQVEQLLDVFNCEISFFLGAFQENSLYFEDVTTESIHISPFNRIDYIEALRNSDILICMGGYNTIIEAISLNKSIVVYNKKFLGGNEEQAIRLKLFEKLDLLTSITKVELENDKLVSKIKESLKLGKRKKIAINLNGAYETTEQLKKLFYVNIDKIKNDYQ